MPTSPRIRTLASRLLPCLCAVLWACGGSQATKAPTTPEPAPPPPLPAEPLVLIPPGATQLVRLDLEELRNWSEYARLSPLIGAADCERGPRVLAMLERVDRVAAAGLAHPPDDGGLLVAHGRFEELTADEVLASAPAIPGKQATQPARSQVGRFEVVSNGAVAVSVLDGQVLVAGDPASVEASLGLAAEPGGPSMATDERVQQLRVTDQPIAGFVLPTSRSAAELKRAAGRVGGPGVADPLAEAETGFGLELHEGLRVTARVTFATPQIAGEMMERVQHMAAQATMFLRMFRLPPIQERLDITIEDRTLVLVLQLPPNEVARVSTLVETTLRPPACPAEPPPPAPGSPAALRQGGAT